MTSATQTDAASGFEFEGRMSKDVLRSLMVKGDYRSNTQSDSCPNGFNQEDTIRKIFLGR